MSTSIDPATTIGAVALTVADLERSLEFYRDVLGFKVVEQANGMAALSAADGEVLLQLTELPGAPPKPARATGLYHFAILVPDRASLGRSLRRLAETRYPLGGASDHGVSEALYLSDPDDNGIEIYADRPRAQWPTEGGKLTMYTNALDLHSVLDAADRPWDGLAAGTRIGHIHLHVADLAAAKAFYCGLLGFDLIVNYGGSALFVSAGGYHHHIGLNTWAGVGVPPAPAGSAGLRDFEIVLPDAAAFEQVAARLAAGGATTETRDGALLVRDPSSNLVRLVVDGSADPA